MTEEIVRKPETSWWKIDLKELWQYRELLYFFVWRDLKVRYRQTVLGVLWVLFQPAAMTIVFSIFFGKLAKIPSDGIPYPLFSYSGLVIWNFFSAGLSNASNSIVASGGIIKKVYLPRLIVPFSAIASSFIDFIVSLLPLILMLFYFRIFPNLFLIIILPVLLATLFLLIAGLGLFLSSVNVRYRDIRYLVPFFLQVGLFVTPVIYPLSVVYDYKKWILSVNPLTGIIENFRLMISGSGNINWLLLTISLVISVIVFVFGLMYFRKTEGDFSDLI